jgi:HK97 family phage portal protein
MPTFDFARAFAADLGGGKAIQPHPALMSNDPVSVYQPGASRQDARIRDRKAPLHGQVYGGTMAMDTAMNCVDFYAQNISAAPWRLESIDGTRLVEKKQKGMPDDFKEGPTELYELLKRPNPFMLYDELIELLIIDLLLVGNAYWFKFGNDPSKPTWLFRCAPSGMEIIPGQIGPKRYEYKPPGVREPIKMEPEQVLHFKLPNPHDGFYGMGIVQKGSRALDLDINVTDTMTSYYGNRADPSVIVQSERRVPRDVFQKLKAQLRQRMSGPANAGQLLVLEAGLKATTLSPSAADALFDAVSNMSESKVYRMFRLSKLLFGEYEKAGAAQIIPAARREADNYVLKPFANKLATRITEHLVASWDARFVIDYNYALSPEEQLKALEVSATLPGIKVRELRRGMLGLGIVDSESTGDSEIDEEVLNMPMETRTVRAALPTGLLVPSPAVRLGARTRPASPVRGRRRARRSVRSMSWVTSCAASRLRPSCSLTARRSASATSLTTNAALATPRVPHATAPWMTSAVACSAIWHRPPCGWSAPC